MQPFLFGQYHGRVDCFLALHEEMPCPPRPSMTAGIGHVCCDPEKDEVVEEEWTDFDSSL